MTNTTMLEQIRRELEAGRGETREISASLVRQWMASTDPQVRGATYAFLHSAHALRVAPALSFDEVFDFTLSYYEWCIRTDPEPGDWADTRYSAGWFLWLWDGGHDRKYSERIKSWLAELYKTGDAALKKAIEHATIEHLFERKQVRKFFADWQHDPELKPAYDEGMLWIMHGGKTPLSRRR